MTTSRVQILLEAKNQASKALKQVSSDLGGLDKAAKGLPALLGSIGGGFAAMQAGRFAIQMAQLNTQIERTGFAFEHFSGGSGQAAVNLRAVQRAAGGAISEFQAMGLATTAMTQGLASNAQELERITKIARGITAVSPVINDMESAFAQLGLTIANQSYMRLDQLGTSAGEVKAKIDELTRANENLTEAQAFETALLDTLEAKFNSLTDAAVNQASGIESLTAAWQDYVQKGVGLAGVVDDVAGGWSIIIRGMTLLSEKTEILKKDYDTLTDAQKRYYDELKGLDIRDDALLGGGDPTTVAYVQQTIDLFHESSAAVEEAKKSVTAYKEEVKQLAGVVQGGFIFDIPGLNFEDQMNAQALKEKIAAQMGPGFQYKIELYYDESEAAQINGAIESSVQRVFEAVYRTTGSMEQANEAAGNAAQKFREVADSGRDAHTEAWQLAVVIREAGQEMVEAANAASEFGTVGQMAMQNVANAGQGLIGVLAGVHSQAVGMITDILSSIGQAYSRIESQVGSQAAGLVPDIGETAALAFYSDSVNAAAENWAKLEAQRQAGLITQGEMNFLQNAYVASLDDTIQAQIQAANAAAKGTSAVGGLSSAYNQLASKIQSVLGVGPVAGVDANDLLPREDAVNENARRLADIAVNGLKGQDWLGEFAAEVPDIFAQISEAGDPQMAAAQLLRDFQDGLLNGTDVLIDREAAKEKVRRMIMGEQSTAELANSIAAELNAEMGVAMGAAQSAAASVLGGGGTGTGEAIIAEVRAAESRIKSAGADAGKQWGQFFLNTVGDGVPGELVQMLATLVTPAVQGNINTSRSRAGAAP